jgi:hypothetical protein
MYVQKRPYFIDKNLLYLFSFEANLEMKPEEIGFVPGGVRVNIRAKPGTPVYHVMNEKSFRGEETLRGEVIDGGDRAFLREDDIAEIDVRLTIRTDDRELIYARYSGRLWLGTRGFRRFVTKKPKLGSEQQPFVAPVTIAPVFETKSVKYAWLSQYQCVGFGQMKIIDSKATTGSFDVCAAVAQ